MIRTNKAALAIGKNFGVNCVLMVEQIKLEFRLKEGDARVLRHLARVQHTSSSVCLQATLVHQTDDPDGHHARALKARHELNGHVEGDDDSLIHLFPA